jgi:hypothetical protein
MNYLINATTVHPSLSLQYLILLFTIDTTTVFILLLLLLFYYCHYYKTIATDKLLRASLFPGAAELTTHLLRLINIIWLPLCRINKFGFYFPRSLLRPPILVGHHQTDPANGNLKTTYSVLQFHFVGSIQRPPARKCKSTFFTKSSNMTAITHNSCNRCISQ